MEAQRRAWIGAIHRVCRTYADTADEREELAQEVVYQLWRAYPSYRGAAAPFTWVYRIALNAAFSALRICAAGS